MCFKRCYVLSGVGVASVQPLEDALQFWTGVSKAQRKKVNFNLTWLKKMGESCHSTYN